MKILFITDNFPPEVNAPASRTFEHCREWVREGHEVTVLTGVPNFPTGKVHAGYRNRLWQSEERDGIRVIRVWTYVTANQGTLRRILDYVSFMMTASIAGLFLRRPDVIVATSPQLFTIVAAWFVSKLRRRPYVFELRDLWPESLKAVGVLNGSPVLRLLERLELFLYRHAAMVISVTHSFRENLIRRGIDAAKVHVVTNGVDLSRFRPMDKDRDLSRQLGLDGSFVLGYVGTHGLAHGLDTILEAAARLRQRGEGGRFRFLFLGDGASKADLVARARELSLDNVLFLDSVAKAEVVRYWSLLDVAIIHLRADELFTTVIPSKLFECMGMGLPVLHGVAGESARIVSVEKVGRVFESGNAMQLEQLVIEMAGQPDELAQMRRNAVDAARRYDRRALAITMLALVEQCASKRT